VQLLEWMTIQLAAQLAKEELSHPEKWVQLTKNYFLRKFKRVVFFFVCFVFFTVSYRVTLKKSKSIDSIYAILSYS